MLESPAQTGESVIADPTASAENTAADQPAANRKQPIGPVGDQPAQLGLRERKKQQTRTRIIEVALDLCAAHGFDATTLEQIANAADISARTINRYFETKEDIILGPVFDFGREVAEALRGLPPRDNQLESLCEAFLQVVDRAALGEGPVPFRQFQQLQRIMRATPSVAARQHEFVESKNAALTDVLAERLGVARDAMSVRMVLSTWQLIGQLGMECSVDAVIATDLPNAAEAARSALTTAYDEFVRSCGGARPVDAFVK
ncbi:TetR/AcrR family transcriptional regulator [Nocardia sp. NPDC052566]|uniref:TetR/AcrR family transcriptional regulator n=1 Tax=Nocardia sp. NPDC052566 TaxID=3364330 RepID=UPI0037CB3B40